MPPTSSHAAPLGPTPLLALICAAVVKAFRPSWLNGTVAELSAEVGVRPERVSRLWRKLLAPMEALLCRASTRGRRKGRRRSEAERARTRAEALLDVAREVNRRGGARRREVQDFLVAARDRLKREEGISHREFSRALGISERTLRSWVARGAMPPETPEPSPPPKEDRPRGVGRFDLARTLPDLQVAGDTTDLAVFGVPLKVVAFQDPGRRHLTPWASFLVESKENHEIVLEALESAIGDRSGIQVVVDQGTPYMAEAVKIACEELELLHEPQKESTPTDKATLERSFGVVKHFLGPLLGLTAKLAEAVPALKDAELAKAFGRLLLGTYLRVFVAAAAVRETGRPDDPTVLEEVAKAQREAAVAEHRSTKLKLEGVFDRYGFEGAKRDFVRAHRHRRLEDIEEAERRLGKQAAATKIEHWGRYFSAILTNVTEERAEARRREASRRRREGRDRARREEEKRRAHSQRECLAADPELRLLTGLKQIAGHYLPDRGVLFNDGVGHGTREVREALAALFRESGAVAVDRAEVSWRNFTEAANTPGVVPLVRRLYEELLDATRQNFPGGATPTGAILSTGSEPRENSRPPLGDDLRLWPAGSGST